MKTKETFDETLNKRRKGGVLTVHNDNSGGIKGYIAVTATWEGPLRPDHAAAFADLRDRVEMIVAKRKHDNGL